GHYVLRSDWGGENGKGFEDARYLFLRGGRFGSHGHDDLNQITLYAYGRPLLIDPGRATYGTPLMSELSKNRSHNVLLVDELDMNHPAPTLKAWHVTPVMDVVENAYSELYPGVEHRRAVVFARPDYYVLFDRATSTDKHVYGINFWLTPPAVTIDERNGRVYTNEPEGSNLLLQAIVRDGITISQRNGTLVLDGKERSDIPVVTFRLSGRSRAEFATLLYPFQRAVAPRVVRVSELDVENGLGCVINSPRGEDIIAYCWEEGRAELSRHGFSFRGLACLARVGDCGFALIGGRLLKLRGMTMAACDNPVGELCVEYADNSVIVSCPEPEPSLRIAALGRKTAIINGKERPVNGRTFMPFSETN
ncbi:MAG: heparinase II/III-family protein, partial [Armatimonadetes bacterium]|nr:heparinase II/III-family protein [Armatimonadota bacterium]